MSADLTGKMVAILATNGFEQSELLEPLTGLSGMGADVHVISPETGEIKGWDEDDWGKSVSVDKALADAVPGDYDALVLPGGLINPDTLRQNKQAINFIRKFSEQKPNSPIAAICHGPWLLIEAGLAEGNKLTSFPSIQTDVKNAGATWVDEEVVVNNRLITSRNPGDLSAFIQAIADQII